MSEKALTPFGHLCTLTREQYEYMIRYKQKSPSRFMGKSVYEPAALAEMRYLACYFNDVCVWDIRRQRVIGMISQPVPLSVDTMAPPFTEFVITMEAKGAKGRYRLTQRRPYAYPHPSGTYER